MEYLETQVWVVFSENRLEKHGNATLQDKWHLAKLASFVPSKKESTTRRSYSSNQNEREDDH